MCENQNRDRCTEVAYHEAAHALFKCKFGHPFTGIWLEPRADGDCEGHTDNQEKRKRSDLSECVLEQRIQVWLAGLAIERLRARKWEPMEKGILGQADKEHARTDLPQARTDLEYILGTPYSEDSDPPSAEESLWESYWRDQAINAYLNGILLRTQWTLHMPPYRVCVDDIAKALLASESGRLDSDTIHEIYRKHFPKGDRRS